MSFEQVKAALELHDQAHLVRFWPELTEAERAGLLAQLRALDFAAVNRLFKRAMAPPSAHQAKLDARLAPIPAAAAASALAAPAAAIQNYRNAGLQEVARGRVAVLLLAGGQGTRLGALRPKGTLPLGLPSGSTLLQLQAERIRRLQQLAAPDAKIPWYIMTSAATHAQTCEFLAQHAHFGLAARDVTVFEQGRLPCFDKEGRVLLESKSSLALAPDGNGGVYAALRESGALADMKRRGVEYVHVHSVDNILTKVADPVFIGYCVTKGADCGAKVVQKEGPTEAVGVVCQVDGEVRVVEYSEITEETARRVDAAGRLVFNAGNICNHFLTVAFLARVCAELEPELPLHVARKRVAHVDERGALVAPARPDAVKVEKFVFDVFRWARTFVTWEVERAREFSALKNGDDAGRDCPRTARDGLLALHRAYLEENGAVVRAEVEVSPLVSYDGEGLEFVNGRVFDGDCVLREGL